MLRADKQQVIEEVKGHFENVMTIVLADFRGLSVATVTAMRDDFRKAGCHYQVIKNTLVKIAVKDTSVAPMTALLAGPTAFIWSTT